MTDENGESGWVDQYSGQSARDLEQAAARLVEAVGRYTSTVTGMRGRPSESGALFEANAAVAAAMEEFNERASDHTGCYPVRLADWDDQDRDEDDEDEDDDEDDELFPTGGPVCVVTRWDLLVQDEDELVAAARTAYLRRRPDEDLEDAAVAVNSVESALSALDDGSAIPWFTVPGLEVLNGAQVFLVPDDPLEPLPDDPDETIDYVTNPPTGRVVFTEAWQVG